MSIKVFSDCGSYNNGYRDPNKPMFGSIAVIVLNEKDDEIIENGEYKLDLNGDIEFVNVSMRYDKERILHNLSFICVYTQPYVYVYKMI